MATSLEPAASVFRPLAVDQENGNGQHSSSRTRVGCSQSPGLTITTSSKPPPRNLTVPAPVWNQESDAGYSCVDVTDIDDECADRREMRRLSS